MNDSYLGTDGLTVGGPAVDVDEVLLKPFGVRKPVGILLLHDVVAHDVAFLEVDEEHLAGLQAGLGHHGLVLQVGEHAHLSARPRRPIEMEGASEERINGPIEQRQQ